MRSSPEIMHCLHGVKLTPAGSEANIICRSVREHMCNRKFCCAASEYVRIHTKSRNLKSQ